MKTYPIPEASLGRLQRAYADFEQLAMIVAEAMGLDILQKFRLDLPNQQFVIEEQEVSALVNGVVDGA